jgi:hypothetical protein
VWLDDDGLQWRCKIIGTSYSAVIPVVEGHRKESAEGMHIPMMGGKQGLYFDGIDLIEDATVVSCVLD